MQSRLRQTCSSPGHKAFCHSPRGQTNFLAPEGNPATGGWYPAKEETDALTFFGQTRASLMMHPPTCTARKISTRVNMCLLSDLHWFTWLSKDQTRLIKIRQGRIRWVSNCLILGLVWSRDTAVVLWLNECMALSFVASTKINVVNIGSIYIGYVCFRLERQGNRHGGSGGDEDVLMGL